MTAPSIEGNVLAALAEPNRLHIVELLRSSPRAVGEIATALGLRQPQATKHLQTLERAGLVTMHPLGQRRIYALRREPLRALARWLDGFDDRHPSESVLERCQAAIEAEHALAAADPDWAAGRVVRLQKTVHARRRAVWKHWTDATLIRRWWSPEHFMVADCKANPVPGGVLKIVMREGDGTRHTARGHYLVLAAPNALSFELAPVGSDGAPLFSARHDVRLTAHDTRTRISLTVRVGDVTFAAAPVLAGLQLGWKQLLDKLARELAA